MKELRVTVKVRNNLLLTAIEKAGYNSIPRFSKDCGVSYHLVLGLINMKIAAVKDSCELTEPVEKICGFLNKMPSDLFTEDQMYNPIENNVSTFAIEISGLLLQYKNPDEQIESEDFLKIVDETLDKLLPRERQVLSSCFGIGCENKTLLEIAKDLGISMERVRQIKAKALFKIRMNKEAMPLLSNYAQAEGLI